MDLGVSVKKKRKDSIALPDWLLSDLRNKGRHKQGVASDRRLSAFIEVWKQSSEDNFVARHGERLVRVISGSGRQPEELKRWLCPDSKLCFGCGQHQLLESESS